MRELLLTLLAWTSLCGAADRDLLASLERSPAPSATRELHALFQRTRSADQRLWLVDALYSRAQTQKDPVAVDILLEAAEDKNADVRRRALSALAGFRLFPEETVRSKWLAKLRDLAARAEAETNPGLNSAGLQLKQVLIQWEEERLGLRPTQPTPAAVPPPSEGLRRRGLGIFLWIIAVQLAAYAWQRIGFFLVQQSGEAGRTMINLWGQFDRRPRLVWFPAAGIVLLVLMLGFMMARLLFLSAVPLQVSGVGYGWAAGARAALGIYLLIGLLAFLPAALLAGFLSAPGGRSDLKPLLSKLPALTVTGLYAMLVAWPWELLSSVTRLKSRSWSARTGVPLAAVYAGLIILRESAGPRAAWRRAAMLFHDGGTPATALLAKTWLQPQFIVLCMAAPAMLAVSILPSMAFAGFRPTRLFGLWFISDATFCVGFGVWAGVLMIGAAYTLIMALNGVYAAQQYGRAKEAA